MQTEDRREFVKENFRIRLSLLAKLCINRFCLLLLLISSLADNSEIHMNIIDTVLVINSKQFIIIYIIYIVIGFIM